MNIEQRKAAKSKLKATYGASLMAELADRTGFSANYIREWFRLGLPQPIIEAKVLDMLREQVEKTQEANALLQ
jgi:hypothetical protein